MQVLLTADIHMNVPQLRWLESQASSVDAVVIAGDVLQLAHGIEKQEQLTQIVPILKRISLERPLLISSGNHDGDSHSPAGEEQAEWVHQLADELKPETDFAGGKYRFTSCPWWNGPETRNQMLHTLEKQKPDSSTQWIWLHHAPPRGSKTAWTLKGDVGDPYLLKLIGKFRPAYILSGHVHNAPFYADGSWCEKIASTWVFNPGKQLGEVPAHIRLDLANRTARYSSLEGPQYQELD